MFVVELKEQMMSIFPQTQEREKKKLNGPLFIIVRVLYIYIHIYICIYNIKE